uniref:Uncharacterized protein n=1 Tax=Arundo donax TaxID=35708 RepID=A0A0A9AJ06_ARUDO
MIFILQHYSVLLFLFFFMNQAVSQLKVVCYSGFCSYVLC